MKKTCLALAVAAAAAAPAFAQNKEALYVKTLAASCAQCHGTNGQPVAGSPVVPLAGLSRDHIVTQMKAFQSGARPATIMHQLAKGYSDDEINQLAAYFAAQKK